MTSSGRNTPFIGREREMAELTAVLDGTLDGRGGLVMLAGEPGIGKTRLTEELTIIARQRGAAVTRGACYENGSTPPYWLWTRAIRSLLNEPSDAVLSALETRAAMIAEIVPEIRGMMPDLPATPEMDPTQARFRLFDAVTSFLSELTASQPLVVVLDDLHWADQSSLDLLEFVADEVSTRSMLLVGGYRDMELTRQHPLSVTLAALARARGFTRVPLRGLESDEVGRLVEAVGNIALPPDLIVEIHVRTEGNPFFVTEVTRDLARAAAVRGVDFDAVQFRVPEGVREAIGIRLNRLSDECSQALRIAAVIGREFDIDLMKLMLRELPAKRFLEVLEEALSASVVEEVPGAEGRCRFVHVLIQETLAEEFSAARRAGLHGEIGEALEGLHASQLEPHADELAYHFANAESASGSSKLVRYSLMAGEQALATYAWEEAQSQFQRGLTAKDGQAIDADKAALLFGLGRAQTHALERHRVHEAIKTARLAFDYYVATEDVTAALAIAEYPFVALHVSAGLAEILAEALELVPSASSPQAGRLLQRYGATLSTETGNFEAAMEALSQSLTIAQRENDTALEVTVLNQMAGAHAHIRFNHQEALEHSLRAIELGRSVGQLQGQQQGHWWAAAALLSLGDLDGARPHATASLALAEKRGGRVNIGQVLSINEGIAHLQGNWETARDFSDRGLAVDHRDARHVSNRAILEYELGDFDQGDSYLERLVETMHLSPPAPTLEYSITSLAIGLAGRITGAARQFDIAEAAADTVLSSPSPVSFFANLARTGLALIAVERDDVTSARKQYDALRPWRITLTGMNHVCGHRVLGLLARTMGRMNDAIAHFDESLAYCRKARARPELAWTSFDYADALIQRSEQGDHSKAVLLADQALKISNDLGMRPLMERAGALQEKVRLLPAETPEYPAGLTEREVEVLRLVASGRSNAEIAGKLVLSIRTVERHISNIYGKTGSGGRVDATAFAFTSGLMSSE